MRSIGFSEKIEPKKYCPIFLVKVYNNHARIIEFEFVINLTIEK